MSIWRVTHASGGVDWVKAERRADVLGLIPDIDDVSDLEVLTIELLPMTDRFALHAYAYPDLFIDLVRAPVDSEGIPAQDEGGRWILQMEVCVWDELYDGPGTIASSRWES